MKEKSRKKRNKSPLQLAKTLGSPLDEAKEKFLQGIQKYETKPKEGVQLLRQAIKLGEKIDNRDRDAALIVSMGVACIYLEQYQKAIEYLEEALKIAREIGNYDIEAGSLSYLGEAYRCTGEVKKAIESEQQILIIARRFKNRELEVAALNNLGKTYNLLGSYQEAIDCLNKSLSLARKFGFQKAEADALGNLGDAYNYLGKFHEAINCHQQSLKIERKIGNPKGEGKSIGALGTVYFDLGEFQKAVQYSKQWLDIAREVCARQDEANALLALGNAHHRLEDYEKALSYFQQCLDIAREIGDRQAELDSLLGFGNVYVSLGNYIEAIKYYEQCLKISQLIGDRQGEANALGNIGTHHLLRFSSENINYYQQSLAIAREIGYPLGEGTCLHHLGVCFMITKQLTAAEQTFFSAIKIWENLRLELIDDVHKVSIFETQAVTYLLLQQVLVAQNKTNDALEIAERGRARAFVELLAKELAAKALGSIQESRLQEFIALPNIDKIKQISLEQKCTIVEYSIIAVNTLYIWSINPTGNIHFRPVDIQPLLEDYNSLEELTKYTHEKIEYGSFYEYKHLLQLLHKYLIEPITDVLPTDPNATIIFIPQGELFLVPFPALQDANTGKFLIEQHTMLIAPSIMSLGLTRQQRERIRNRYSAAETDYIDAIVVGNPTMPIDIDSQPPKQLKPLLGAEEEAKEIASLLNTEAIFGDKATKVDIVQQMPKARLIHLATHGLLNDIHKSGIPGAIALAPSDNDNGYLTSSEILDLDLNAELVVLSACETGKGNITGDGVIGLSRCLFLAGVPSVIVSLWEVQDRSTKELMTNFYQNLQKGMNKAQALREAILTAMETYRNCPNFWAAFTLIGEAE
ncbi:MAG TPA: Fis family transcriptional regulator [Cyanobacteria bacterium UBA11369]|nr:Fis family transcriptional regulator [Cyanobacteria bacterium UBA11371]HBE33217.1 Fis family transcriptional regulator [Cyanobacteria bacterium UBA11368]HBE49358.1 Fis family transcriptional regulator [Cyanobacteria bacterium UBA11369]